MSLIFPNRIAIAWQGDKYGLGYIDALLLQLKEHLSDPIFLIMTDHPELFPEVGAQMKAVSLQPEFKGWWSKLEIFNPKHAWFRPCLMMDLDTFVRADISDMASYQYPSLHLIRDFTKPQRGNSGLVGVPKYTDGIWDRRSDMVNYHGDGDFLDSFPHGYLNDLFGGIVSFKKHCRDVPHGRVVCFHGEPKPHQVRDGWARDYWRRYRLGNEGSSATD